VAERGLFGRFLGFFGPKKPDPLTLAGLAEEARARIAAPEPYDLLWFDEHAQPLAGFAETAELQVDLLVDAVMDFIRFYYSRGLAGTRPEPELLTRAAVVAADKWGHPAKRRVITHARGVVLRSAGRPSDAMTAFARALEIAEKSGDLVSQAQEIASLGACAFDLAWYKGTIEYCRRSLAILSSLSGTDAGRDVRMLCNLSIATASLHLIYRDEDSSSEGGGYLAEGLRTIQNAAREAGEPKTALEMGRCASMRLTQANLLARVGRLAEMEEAIVACEEYAAKTQNPKTAFHAKVARRVLEGLRDRTPVAIAALEEMAMAEPSGSELRLDALVAAAQVADTLKDGATYRAIKDQLYTEWGAKEALINQKRFDFYAKVAAARTDPWTAAVAESVDTFAVLSEIFDDQTGAHVFRVGALAALIAKQLGWSPQACEELDYAARLHDVGKCAVHADILSKPTRLTAAEMGEMQKHTTIGHELLTRISHPVMELAADIALHHHERWDGAGYPRQLAGEQIPIAARIASVADVFDALTHKRSYKEAWPVDQAIDTIKEMRGLNFDPVVVDAALLTIESLIAEHGYEGMDALLSARAAENPTVAARAFFRRSFQSSVARAAS